MNETDLIHDERNTPYPFEATQGSPSSPRNAYELLKSELAFFILNTRDMNSTDVSTISDETLQREACRILFGAEVLSKSASSPPSWLRDLILSKETITREARLAPIKSAADSRQAQLKINGKDNIFEEDAMELELHEFVKARQFLGLTATDEELQVEACKIIGRIEETTNNPSELVANFLLRLIYGSSDWLASFRQRAVLPRSEDMAHESIRSKDPKTVDSTIYNYSRLESELVEYVKIRHSLGLEPTDADLQKQARIIIYEFDDEWNQTAADNLDWLNAFRQRNFPGSVAGALDKNSPMTIASATKPSSQGQPAASLGSPIHSLSAPSQSPSGGLGTGLYTNSSVTCDSGGGSVKLGSFFLNDANCYRRLAKELGRFVASTMSPNNPNSHVPSDEELQHQARWILYDR